MANRVKQCGPSVTVKLRRLYREAYAKDCDLSNALLSIFWFEAKQEKGFSRETKKVTEAVWQRTLEKIHYCL